MEQTTDMKEVEEHVHSHSEITRSFPAKDTLLLNEFANPKSVNYATRNLFKTTEFYDEMRMNVTT
ncbi:Hypothetical predicted protein, partial [Paramuricea clavata]